MQVEIKAAEKSLAETEEPLSAGICEWSLSREGRRSAGLRRRPASWRRSPARAREASAEPQFGLSRFRPLREWPWPILGARSTTEAVMPASRRRGRRW